ncbi:hypothetical protein V8E36_002108 [Tilletia maclaganii]
MQIRALIPIVAVLSTFMASANAVNLNWVSSCSEHADTICPGNNQPVGAWSQYFQVCMQQTWTGASANTQCPYTDVVNCRCYNGCVADRHDIYPNVGQQCHASCQLITNFIGCKKS